MDTLDWAIFDQDFELAVDMFASAFAPPQSSRICNHCGIWIDDLGRCNCNSVAPSLPHVVTIQQDQCSGLWHWAQQFTGITATSKEAYASPFEAIRHARNIAQCFGMPLDIPADAIRGG